MRVENGFHKRRERLRLLVQLSSAPHPRGKFLLLRAPFAEARSELGVHAKSLEARAILRAGQAEERLRYSYV